MADDRTWTEGRTVASSQGWMRIDQDDAWKVLNLEPGGEEVPSNCWLGLHYPAEETDPRFREGQQLAQGHRARQGSELTS